MEASKIMKNLFTRVGAIAAVALLPVSSAYAQNIDLSTGGADQIWHGTAGSKAGFWLDQGPVSPGDNRRDLVIGAPGSGATAGRVHIIFGGPVFSGDLNLTSANVTITSATTGDEFGTSTAVGPITVTSSSLTSNLVVGAPGALGGRGAVYLFATPLNNGNLTTANAVFTILGAPGDRLGSALATADINNDGYREIVIGAPGTGRIYIIAGSSSLAGRPNRDLGITGGDLLITGTGIGNSIQAGDVTGDGIFEILVGAPSQNAVYLLTGGYPEVSVLPGHADAVFTGIDAGDEAGLSIRIADLDGEDGRRDIIIGAPGGDGPGNSRANAGEAYVIWGRAAFGSMSLALADVTFHGAATGQRMAQYMTAGDVNRDTPNDVVFGVPGAGAAGELHVFYGRAKNAFGTDLGGDRRLVDLAVVGASRRIIGSAAAGPLASAQVYEVTGEGARDIVGGVPTNNGNAGAVYFTISPKMVANPAAISLSVEQGQPASRALVVENASTVPIEWTVTDNQPWVAVSPPSGSSSLDNYGSTSLHFVTTGLAVGVHTAIVTVTSTSTHLTMSATVEVTLTVTAPPPPPPPPPTAKNDFNGDGNMDLLWQNISDGYLATWSLNGTSLMSSDLLSPNRVSDNNWRIVGTGDFNGDYKPDIVWQEQTQGWVGIWLMNGTTLLSSTTLSPAARERVADTNWKIAGVMDLNNDNRVDILWQEQTQGWLVAWLLNGTTVMSSVALNPERVPDTNWKIVASGDFNADNKTDLIWQNMATGYLAAWLMDGLNLVESVLLSPRYVTDVNWKIVASGDVDKDGKPDLIWQDQSQGWLAIWLMNGTTLSSSVGFNPERVPDTNWKIVGPK